MNSLLLKKMNIYTPPMNKSLYNATMAAKLSDTITSKDLDDLVTHYVKAENEATARLKAIANEISSELKDLLQNIKTTTPELSEIVIPVGMDKNTHSKFLKASKKLLELDGITATILSTDDEILTKELKVITDTIEDFGYDLIYTSNEYSAYTIKDSEYQDILQKDSTLADLGYTENDLGKFQSIIEEQKILLKTNIVNKCITQVREAASKVITDLDKLDKDDEKFDEKVKLYSVQLSRAYLYFQLLSIIFGRFCRDPYVLMGTILTTVAEEPKEEVEDTPTEEPEPEGTSDETTEPTEEPAEEPTTEQ